MRKIILPALIVSCLLFGCGAGPQGQADTSGASPAGGAGAFNPWLNASLPNTRSIGSEGQEMLGAMGGHAQSIEGEAAHRKNWREEIYPIVFGQKDAPHEILAVLDFANPQSEKAWEAVEAASRQLSPASCKIVVFGRSGENYGTDLMGLAIWIAVNRPDQAMPYLTYALKRWNEVKAAQKAAGAQKKFINEYDAVASAHDYPIHYNYLARLKPPVPASQELAVAKYCYDAGNVNMYQANQVCQYYGVKSLPAVIVDGRPLASISADAILAALK